jgi:hypothetical protein
MSLYYFFRFGHNEIFFLKMLIIFLKLYIWNEITKEMKILKMVETQELLA